MTNPLMKQQSLFPSRDSLQQVMEEAKAALPITSENQITTLMQLHYNTLINLLETPDELCSKDP